MRAPTRTGTPLVLVIDGGRARDDPFFEGLASEGLLVVQATSGDEGLGLYASLHPDVVLVGATLPDLSMSAVLRVLHEAGATPVIALSDSDDENEAILALEIGAVDVISRPTRIGESAARIWSAVRCPIPTPLDALPTATTGGPEKLGEVVAAGPVEVDRVRREVRVRGRKVDARPMELALLELLVANAGHSVSRAKLLGTLWPELPEDLAKKRLDVHVRRARFLVEEDVSQPVHIITLRGYGHRFDP